MQPVINIAVTTLIRFGKFDLLAIDSTSTRSLLSGGAIGKSPIKYPDGLKASSFMWGKYRQLCHHIKGDFNTPNKYRSEDGMMNTLLFAK